MAFNSKRSKFIIVALIAMLLFGNTLPKGAKAEELFQEESFSDIEETDPTPSPSAVSQTTPSAAPVSLQDEQLSEETPVPQASAGQTEKPTEATPAPTPSPSATQKPETTKTPEASATPLAKKDSFQSGYAEILKGTEVYSVEELYGNSLLGQFTESGSLVYVIERYGEGSSDKEVVLIAFAAMESDELTAQFAYTRVRNLKPIDPKKEKNVKRLISNGAYVYFDEEKEYPVGKCAFEFAALLEEPEILEEETLSEEEILSEEQGLFDQEISAEESVISEEAKDSSDPINSGTDATVEEGDTAPESDSVVSEVLGEAQKQIDMSATQESAEKTDSLFEERQSEDTLADPISAESEERTEAAITEDTPDEEEVETWTSDAITEIIPSDNAALDDQLEAEKEETESSEVVIEPIPSNEAVSDDQNPEENLANDEKGEAALSNQENSTEESQDASDDSVQAVSSEKKAEEEELLEEEVLFGGEYAERASEEMKAEETLIEEALPDDSVVVELNAADNSDSEREPKPVSFTPRVALMGEGQTRSFTLSADSYNPEGAELGEVTKVTVEGGEEAAFSDIEFTEAGTYGFAIKDDAQEEYPWELTVVVDENADLEQLYIDTTRTLYASGESFALANNTSAVFNNERIANNNSSNTEYKPVTAYIRVKKHIDLPTSLSPDPKYPCFPKYNGSFVTFPIRLEAVGDAPMPQEKSEDGYIKRLPITFYTQNEINSSIEEFAIEYDVPGEYEYTIKEFISNPSNVVPCFDWDTTDHKIRVVIKETEADKELKATVEYLDADESESYLTITNHYKCNTVEIKKAILGDVNSDQSFSINFQLNDNGSNFFSKFIDRFNIFYLEYDKYGNPKSSIPQHFIGKTEFQLKGNEYVRIFGLPEGIGYKVKEQDSGAYITTYDGYEADSVAIIRESEKPDVVLVTNEIISFDSIRFETQISILPYEHSVSNTFYKDTPWGKLDFQVVLTGEDNAPMPIGAENGTLVCKVPINAHKTASEIIPLGDIVFTKAGDYRYKIKQSTSDRYSFLEYDNQEYSYLVEVRNSEDSEHLLIRIVLESSQNETIAEFENTYIGTDMRILKSVSGKGASSTYTFPITIRFYRKSGDNEIPYGNWQYLVSYFRVNPTTNTSQMTSKPKLITANSSGEITVQLSHRGFVWIYGIPDGVRYSVSEASQTHYVPEYSCYTKEDTTTSEKETINRSGRIDDEKYYYFDIKNKYSAIPLTGYGNPIIKTILLISLLSLASVCTYARRKLR